MDLIGKPFWTVFWECFHCEYVYTSLINIWHVMHSRSSSALC
jgi:hypothetical protein